MATFSVPLRDMRFVFHEVMRGEDLTDLPAYQEFTADVIDAVLEEASKISEAVLFPLNRSGDEEGCTLENGVVRTPSGFQNAYRTYCDGGWSAISSDPAYGGQGMPKAVGILVEEMVCAANLSFSIYPGLTHGAIVSLQGFGTEAQKRTYLPNMISGKWSGTMCLTEPHCGTDLGLLRTRAEPQADGSYTLTGTKIFISSGDHDLTENIIHLVLARLPDAPEGIKGVSLFLVPKFLVTDDGAPGQRNGVTCGSLEHKMGLKASATCVMNFDAARGWMVGEPHKGMRAMFAMMNAERLSVGVQGLGVSAASYCGAVEYARERHQGRAATGAKAPDKAADPLLVHPDIRRMLLTQRAYVEAGRALAVWTAKSLDIAAHHPEPEARQAADDFVALVTPVVKALFTDLGTELTNLGLQVFGGHGYIREWGMEQYVRDVRITQIYEGANGIQALDLVGRKLPAHDGRLLRTVVAPITTFIETKEGDPALAEFVEPLKATLARLQNATIYIARSARGNPDEVGAAATDYLRLLGLTLYAYLWAQMAEIALSKMAGEDPGSFYKAKVDTARFFVKRLLPQTIGLHEAILSGSDTMMAFDEAAF